MKNAVMKKITAATLAAGLCVCGALAACSPGSDVSGEMTISFMHMWPEHENVMNQLLDKFEQDNPGVKVTRSFTPFDQIEQVLQAAYISNELPNVYVFYTHYMTPLVSSTDGVMAGTLNDVREEIIDDFVQSDSWEMGKINGNYYSVPFRTTAELIFYNKTMFDAKGWERPRTFEELDALLAEISADGSYTPLAVGGKEEQITYMVNAMSLFSGILDGSVDEPGYAVGRLEPDEDDNTPVLIYEKVRKWYEKGYFGKGAIAVSKTGAIKEFTSGNAAMVFANVNNMGEVTSLMPNSEIGIFGIPAPAAIADQVKYVYGGYDGLSYNPTASDEKIEVSKKLIKYLVSSDVQQVLADRAQCITVNKDVVYHDATYEAFAEECKYVGAYSSGTDYITGSNSAGNGTLISSYIAGTSGQSAAQIIKTINNNVWKDMQDSLLNNPTRDWYPRQNAKKEYDKSWLN